MTQTVTFPVCNVTEFTLRSDLLRIKFMWHVTSCDAFNAPVTHLGVSIMNKTPEIAASKAKELTGWIALRQRGAERSRDVVLSCYLSDIGSLKWAEESRRESLVEALQAIDGWAGEQIRYYDDKRRRQMRWSVGIRFFAWLFGSAGVILPLAGAIHNLGAGTAALGYVFLAVSGSFIALNALFGVTRGHIRAMRAQLALEKLIIETHAKWCSIFATSKPEGLSDEKFAEALGLIHSYGSAMYTIIIEETDEWGGAALQSLQAFEEKIERHQNEIREKQKAEHELTKKEEQAA